MPNYEDFISLLDTEQISLEKEKFYHKIKNDPWNFKKELLEHCQTDLKILIYSSYQFIESCLSFQLKCQDIFEKKMPVLHPFAEKMTTLPAYIYQTFKIFCCSEFPIHAIANELGLKRNTSKGETEFTLFYHYANPNKKIITYYNNPAGPKHFKETTIDLYLPDDKKAIYYHGCFYHKHVCMFKKEIAEEFEELFQKKMKALKRKYPSEVKTVEVIWECEWHLMKQNDPQVKHFMENIFEAIPLQRLAPRDSLHGGRTEVYGFKWKKLDSTEETFFFHDVNSLYSYVAMDFEEFPISTYKIIIGDDLSFVHFQNTKYFYKEEPLVGIALVKVIPPRNLEIPFILYEKPDGDKVAVLCKTCCDLKSFSRCKHPDNRRSFFATLTFPEINYAVELKYQFKFYEIFHYSQTGPIFQKFYRILAHYKLKYAGFPPNVFTKEQKQSYVDSINKEMKFCDKLKLTLENVERKEKEISMIKSCGNSIFGKLSQKADFPRNIYVLSYSELIQFYRSIKYSIEDILVINSDICQVVVRPKKDILQVNRNTNVILASYVFGLSKIKMQKHIMELLEKKAKIFYMDTDSLAYSLPKSTQTPLKVSNCYGHFKSLVSDSEIVSFVTLSPKTYSLVCHKNGTTKKIIKLKGLALNSVYLSEYVNPKTFDHFLISYLHDVMTYIRVPQIRNKISKVSKSINPKLETHFFRNELTKKRALIKTDKDIFTKPYGYNK